MLFKRAPGWICAATLLAAVLAGCSSGPRRPAPVEDRRPARVGTVGEAPRHLPGAENAGKPGYYTVRPGDTLVRISLETGHNWRDIARWNNIDNPNLIEVGQVLRVEPPASPPAAPETAVAKPVGHAPVVAAVPLNAAASPPSGTTPTRVVTPAQPPGGELPINTPPVAPGDDEIVWAWPSAGGPVLAGFDEQKNKGMDIGGKAGDAVLAAADGRVVYAGAGLRGYGNLIILKHNNTYLTAYAHNQALMVKEDQVVRKGQKIAEMGTSDTDRVKLHFEIRRQGKPVDPAKFLPPR